MYAHNLFVYKTEHVQQNGWAPLTRAIIIKIIIKISIGPYSTGQRDTIVYDNVVFLARHRRVVVLAHDNYILACVPAETRSLSIFLSYGI